MQLANIGAVVLLVAVVVVGIPLLLGAVFVIVVVANRADADPTGRRPAAVYAFATAFITLFTTLFATTGIVASLASLIGKHSNGQGGLLHLGASAVDGSSRHPVGDAAARGVVLGAIIAIVAGAVFLRHIRAAAAASQELDPALPVTRVRSSYVAAVSFVSVALAVIATIVVSYDVFALISPAVFAPNSQSRVGALRTMLPTLWLGIGALLILLSHLQHAPAPFRAGRWDRWRVFPDAADQATGTSG